MALTPADKLAAYKTFRALDCEGVVFKEIDAPASSGRPNSGGSASTVYGGKRRDIPEFDCLMSQLKMKATT